MEGRFRTVWVVGLGAVGAATAVLLATSGRRVVGVVPDAATLTETGERLERLVRAARPNDAEEVLARLELTTRMDTAAPADLVVEAVPERLDTKTNVLARAHALCPPGAVFVTTAMTLSVTEIAARSGRMSRTVGLTLCEPGRPDASVVELAGTPVTDADVLADVRALAGELGRTPVDVHDRPGLIGHGLRLGYLNAAARMYGEGYASRDDIDTAMTLGCGLPVGPLAQLDRMGVDVALDALTALHERTGEPQHRPAPLLTAMASAGLLGVKTGRGFHDYRTSPDSTTAPVAAPSARLPERIGIIGSGTMARGIAEVLTTSGFATTLVARTELRTKEAGAAVERSLDRRVRRGRITPDALAAAIDLLTCETELGAIAGCDVVIEAVAEDLGVKRRVFGELDAIARPGAVLATTTSSLSVLDCATATGRPQDVVGLHFFNPPPAMRLVEVVRTLFTAPEVVAGALALTRALGKTPVACADRTGFIVNALLFPYLNNAVAAVERHHVAVADVDRVITGAHGHPMGPFRLLDTIGLDVALAIQESLHAAFAPVVPAPARHLTDLVAAGVLGRKSGRGFLGHDGGAV
ncbi:3-hydroxyacyl-CoA dehydrogenase family protein [Lentzea sp. JNUCC 0626]|uniref:3-hydroxyacyl-CoA dehydrogenase family protein n=1 Tax=Lentzea sp. JNUCC 0626 TaxID=3367513 RepID=UPI00374813B0